MTVFPNYYIIDTTYPDKDKETGSYSFTIDCNLFDPVNEGFADRSFFFNTACNGDLSQEHWFMGNYFAELEPYEWFVCPVFECQFHHNEEDTKVLKFTYFFNGYIYINEFTPYPHKHIQEQIQKYLPPCPIGIIEKCHI